MGKSFQKKIKTIEDQEQKQIKAIEDNKKQYTNTSDYKNKLSISKERYIFKNTYDKRLNKIEELGNKVNYDDLS